MAQIQPLKTSISEVRESKKMVLKKNKVAINSHGVHAAVSCVQGGACGKHSRRHVHFSRGYDVPDRGTPQPSGSGSEICGDCVSEVGFELHGAGCSISPSQAGAFTFIVLMCCY